MADVIRWIAIAAGTKPTRCNGPSCGAEIYFVRNPVSGRMTPGSCDVDGAERPSDTKDPSQLDAFAGEVTIRDGKGVSHFTNCPDAGIFSRGGAR